MNTTPNAITPPTPEKKVNKSIYSPLKQTGNPPSARQRSSAGATATAKQTTTPPRPAPSQNQPAPPYPAGNPSLGVPQPPYQTPPGQPKTPFRQGQKSPYPTTGTPSPGNAPYPVAYPSTSPVLASVQQGQQQQIGGGASPYPGQQAPRPTSPVPKGIPPAPQRQLFQGQRVMNAGAYVPMEGPPPYPVGQKPVAPANAPQDVIQATPTIVHPVMQGGNAGQDGQDNLPLDDLDLVAQRQQIPTVSNSTTIQISTPTLQKASSVMRRFVEHAVGAGIENLLTEYDNIVKALKAPPPHSVFMEHKDKNRYTDVRCLDDTRVKLYFPSGNEYSDYIHANWVTSPNGRKLICTQGPMKSSITDFWRMVWQEKVQGIVMLCNVMEEGKKKCEKYWPSPEGHTMNHGPMFIRCDGVEVIEPTLTVHKLTLMCERDHSVQQQVEHCLWTGWPDRGVPTEYYPVFKLLKKMKSFNPAVIHCSAGIGRTGAITSIDLLLAKLLLGQSALFKETVTDLRLRRWGAVQTPMQYLFIHRFIIEIALKNRLTTQREVSAWISDYEKHYEKKGKN